MSYYLDVDHPGLGKFRRIFSLDPLVLRRKADEQLAAWETQWKHKLQVEEQLSLGTPWAASAGQRKAHALQQTEQAKKELSEVRQILRATLSLDSATWTSLYDD